MDFYDKKYIEVWFIKETIKTVLFKRIFLQTEFWNHNTDG